MPDDTPRTLLYPPAIEPRTEIAGDWFDVPADDALTGYVAAALWPHAAPPAGWQAARLSNAAYVYRERGTGWPVLAKFYTVKTKDEAPTYAAREDARTREAAAAGLGEGPHRAARSLGVWRGVLFLEYVAGLTLADVIAVRRSQPGRLLPALEGAAVLLARLHAGTPQATAAPDFAHDVRYAHKLVAHLSRYGVLQDNPVVVEGATRLIDAWAAQPEMDDYTPALIHGDATTTNFIYPPDGGVVGIDWERARPADPASDLGRLLAEAAHSIVGYGGSVAEAASLTDHVRGVYCASLAGADGGCTLAARLRFHQASSTLRIARNGWLPDLTRMSLVSQAMALLAPGP